ncbi:Ger(x)C family spore germination protein [Paenibacillus validus]|uniref:Ger(x)C family spore germination protein n=1 Tax=Paenibacillus TaxID=44249 RepID=UPI0013DE96F0|nr:MULTISPECIES: Ger(x)C family spore germination protein [Paenibacillus]MED4601033.1 Ger(x)C family spore germination protein [Paenibacillus validus]
MMNNVMRKKMFVCIWILLLFIPLGGCWDIKYLDELSTVIAMGMDTSEGQDIQLTVQVVNPAEVSTGGGKGGGGSSSSVTTYSETGRTVFEAIRKIANKTSRRLYFAHNQVLVIGEDLARKGVTPLFDLIERDPEVRTDFYVLVAKGAKASDLLKIKTPIEKIPGTKMRESVENAEQILGTSYRMSIKEMIANINSGKKEISMGSIEIIGDIKKGGNNKNVEKINPSASLKLNGMAVFKNQTLVDFLDPKESRGSAWIQDKVKSTVINVSCKKESDIAVEVVHSTTSMKGKFQQGQPSIVIHVKQEANIAEILCSDMDLTDKETFAQIGKETEAQIKKEMLDAVKKAKKLKTDIFGFADAVYKANPAYWKKNMNNWAYIFSKIPVHIEVDTEIRREGLRYKSYFGNDRREKKE